MVGSSWVSSAVDGLRPMNTVSSRLAAWGSEASTEMVSVMVMGSDSFGIFVWVVGLRSIALRADVGAAFELMATGAADSLWGDACGNLGSMLIAPAINIQSMAAERTDPGKWWWAWGVRFHSNLSSVPVFPCLQRLVPSFQHVTKEPGKDEVRCVAAVFHRLAIDELFKLLKEGGFHLFVATMAVS